jgi:lipid-binding SYLF domain-containing protein
VRTGVTSAVGAAVVAVMAVGQARASGWDPEREKHELAAAHDTIAAFRRADPRLAAYFKDAYGFAVFPTIGRGGFVLAGGYGTGTVFERGAVVGSASVTQATVGLQAGVEVVSELIFFADKAAFEEFTSGSLKLAAEASAYAISQGAAVKAAYNRGVAVFVNAKSGLMAEASIGGQRFSFRPTAR